VLHLVLALALSGPQEPTPPPPLQQPASQEALRVYLDCSMCDFDFFRTEITFVNWVRDRHDAQVDILVSTQGTAAGGTEYTLTFIGQKEFEGRSDTLRYVSRPAETDDAIRRGLAHAMSLGLVRFVAQTPLAGELEVRRAGLPPGAGPTQHPHDPWNYWVFNVGTSANANGDASDRYSYYSANLSANRITDSWKTLLSVYGSWTRNAYQVPDSLGNLYWFVSPTHTFTFSGMLVRSLGRHWSAGAQASALSSSYYNRDYNFVVGPAVEYDLFPYEQSTRRQLRFLYAVNLERDVYDQITLYGKTAQTMPNHALTVALSLREKWGTVQLSLNGTQYLNDLSKYDAGLYGGFTVQLVRGLSVGASGNYSAVHDQLYLPAADASSLEIVARQRQLATQYTYFVYYSITYTFGSIFNNVVNPRFGASGSGGSSCFCF
jgi:hypothetical protein